MTASVVAATALIGPTSVRETTTFLPPSRPRQNVHAAIWMRVAPVSDSTSGATSASTAPWMTMSTAMDSGAGPVDGLPDAVRVAHAAATAHARARTRTSGRVIRMACSISRYRRRRRECPTEGASRWEGQNSNALSSTRPYHTPWKPARESPQTRCMVCLSIDRSWISSPNPPPSRNGSRAGDFAWLTRSGLL